jgi:hypothetical protein
MERVEQHLGPIDTWPTYIIRLLFIEDPTPANVKKLTAFFGNGVPVDDAADLYYLCNDHVHLHTKCDLHDFCVTWQSRRHRIHIHKYYNLKKHSFMWINGASKNQNEHVFPPVTSMPFGIQSAGYGPFVTDRLHLVRNGVKAECHCIFCTNKIHTLPP